MQKLKSLIFKRLPKTVFGVGLGFKVMSPDNNKSI